MNAVVIFSVVLLLIDLYVFKGLSDLLSPASGNGKMAFNIIYWLISAGVIFGLYYAVTNRHSFTNNNTLTMFIGVFMCLFMPKFIFLVFHALDDLTNLAFFGYSKLSGTDFSRRTFFSQLGALSGSLMFGGMVYGILWGKFDFRVRKETISSSKIPADFDGFKIVQISDAHLGSFGSDTEPVSKAIEMINDLQPDCVFFTGDLVNNHASEAEPWIELFSKIRAKEGKFSVFGNHDYADYGNFSKEEKLASINRLREIHKEMGFRLLEDENLRITRGNETITVVGVHNWGHGFHQVGDLSKALQGTDPQQFQILLSHDPTHFEFQVKGKTSIDLTLSGHTHGMQMGIEIPALNIKWSPVRFRYARWAGLYNEMEQQIYINRGFGVLAYPGRVGMAPEITLLTLKSQT